MSMEVTIMTSEAKKKSKARFDKLNTRHVSLKFNVRTDADILQKIDEVGSTQTYIKKLIREDIAKQNKRED